MQQYVETLIFETRELDLVLICVVSINILVPSPTVSARSRRVNAWTCGKDNFKGNCMVVFRGDVSGTRSDNYTLCAVCSIYDLMQHTIEPHVQCIYSIFWNWVFTYCRIMVSSGLGLDRSKFRKLLDRPVHFFGWTVKSLVWKWLAWPYRNTSAVTNLHYWPNRQTHL